MPLPEQPHHLIFSLIPKHHTGSIKRIISWISASVGSGSPQSLGNGESISAGGQRHGYKIFLWKHYCHQSHSTPQVCHRWTQNFVTLFPTLPKWISGEYGEGKQTPVLHCHQNAGIVLLNNFVRIELGMRVPGSTHNLPPKHQKDPNLFVRPIRTAHHLDLSIPLCQATARRVADPWHQSPRDGPSLWFQRPPRIEDFSMKLRGRELDGENYFDKTQKYVV